MDLEKLKMRKERKYLKSQKRWKNPRPGCLFSVRDESAERKGADVDPFVGAIQRE